MSQCVVANVWHEKTGFRNLDFAVGLLKLGAGATLASYQVRKFPIQTAAALLITTAVLDVAPTLYSGCKAQNTLSYRTKTASVLRGAQLAAVVLLTTLAIDRADQIWNRLGWGWHVFDRQVVDAGVGAAACGLSGLYAVYLIAFKVETEPREGYNSRCSTCALLDCEPVWDLR